MMIFVSDAPLVTLGPHYLEFDLSTTSIGQPFKTGFATWETVLSLTLSERQARQYVTLQRSSGKAWGFYNIKINFISKYSEWAHDCTNTCNYALLCYLGHCGDTLTYTASPQFMKCYRVSPLFLGACPDENESFASIHSAEENEFIKGKDAR